MLTKILSIIRGVKSLLCNARRVKKTYGKGVISQLYEIIVLRFSRGKLLPNEYYFYHLYNDNRFTFNDKKSYIGLRAQREINERFNCKQWHGIANDKLIFYAVLKGLGLPHPEIYGIYGRVPRFYGGVPSITEPEPLREFLQNNIKIPFFLKPVFGAFGQGAIGIQSYNKSKNKIILTNGDNIDFEVLISKISSNLKSEYLFQEYLTPHPNIKNVCGNRLSTMRLIVNLTQEGPVLSKALWKIQTGNNMIDNYSQGKTGNLLAKIDLETGMVAKVFGQAENGITEYEFKEHPDTNKPLTGILLPDWEDMVSLCLKTASAFPGFRMQHWDLAICQRGPVFLELNALGVFDMPQLICGSGIYDEKLDNVL